MHRYEFTNALPFSKIWLLLADPVHCVPVMLPAVVIKRSVQLGARTAHARLVAIVVLYRYAHLVHVTSGTRLTIARRLDVALWTACGHVCALLLWHSRLGADAYILQHTPNVGSHAAPVEHSPALAAVAGLQRMM